MEERSDKPLLLMTGASGLIGAKLQKRFAHDHTVINLDIVQGQTQDMGTHFIRCDLTDDRSVMAAFKAVRERFGTKIESVFHLAAYYDFSGADSPLYRTLTLEGTKRLLHHLRSFEVGQLVFSSTNLVMKPVHRTDQVITEDDPLLGQWAYPISKIEAESFLKQDHGDIPLVILRIAGGYDERGHSPPIANQIKRIYEGQLQSRFYPGDMSLGQAFIHLDDVVEMFAAVLSHRRELSDEEVFFVAEPQVMSYQEIQLLLGRLIHQKKWPTLRIPKIVAKIGAFLLGLFGGDKAFIKPWMIDLTDDHYPLSMERAKKKLGYQPQHHLDQTLPDMIKFLKADPIGFYETNKLAIANKILLQESYATVIDLNARPKPWRRNPSSWTQRIAIALIASIAVVIATYMSLYQLGFISYVWDPIFGEQSMRVLKSDVSHEMSNWFRIPDALLGALAYLGDIIFALAGSTRRWQFRPWLVILFGIDVIPLGIVSIILVFMQGLVVQQWCFLCLATALISLILIVLAYDEVWSSCRFLWRVWQKTKSPKILWKTLWGIATPEAHEIGETMIRRD